MSFWDKLDKQPNDCWVWKGATWEFGYGLFTLNKKRWRTHRYAYTLQNGTIPDGMVILHSCDNPPCCNPAHLSLGTHADNVADRVNKGRGRVPIGEKQIFAKLTDEKVREIRKLYATGLYSYADLAEVYKVDRSGIRRVVNLETWRHVV